MRLHVCISLSVCMSTCLFVCLLVCLSVCQSVSLGLTLRLSAYHTLSLFRSVFVLLLLTTSSSVCLPLCLRVCLCASFLDCWSVCPCLLSFWSSVYLFGCFICPILGTVCEHVCESVETVCESGCEYVHDSMSMAVNPQSVYL